MVLTSHWSAVTVLGWPGYLLLWLFLVYGFLGLVVETVFCLVRGGVLESRLGLLYLPLRPMYGVGGVACTLLLDPHLHPVAVFLAGMVICTAVEYLGGSICDRAFGTLSWDYRSKALHLHGKICLEYSCYWGLLAALVVYLFTPLIGEGVGRVDRTTGESVLSALLGLTLASMVLTAAAWRRAGRRVGVRRAPAVGRGPAGQAGLAGRMVDLLVPDQVLINTFPRTRLAQELAVLTGRQPFVVRAWTSPVAPDATPAGPTRVTYACADDVRDVAARPPEAVVAVRDVTNGARDARRLPARQLHRRPARAAGS